MESGLMMMVLLVTILTIVQLFWRNTIEKNRLSRTYIIVVIGLMWLLIVLTLPNNL